MKYLLLTCLLVLSGCSKPVENQKMYHDGTYKAMCNGYGGEFEVTIEIKDDQIVNAYVPSHNETPSIGGVAIEQIIGYMKDEGSSDVISGATITSTALLEGINEAKKQAEIK